MDGYQLSRNATHDEKGQMGMQVNEKKTSRDPMKLGQREIHS